MDAISAGDVAAHYSDDADLAERIATGLRDAGKDPGDLTTADLASVDEFHVRGRTATLEIIEALGVQPDWAVLDIGSGLGGPARTVAETVGCAVTGIDLTPSFCAAATELSRWTGLDALTSFRVADATALPFPDATYDAAMSIHVTMNIPDKAAVYAEAHRVLEPGGLFALYDIMQGEGGDVLFPVPWAREPSLSHLATPDETRQLMTAAGFEVIRETDSSAESLAWFQDMATRLAASGPPAVSFGVFLGADFPEMTRNQVDNLRDRRIRTVTMIGRAAPAPAG